MGKVIILGFDGMDFDYMHSMLDELQNIKRLSNTKTVKPFRSVFPPDSIPSWITCYTGKDPSDHGVLESVNYLAKGDDRLKVDTSEFKGNTFWDIISGQGHEVCVINPFMAYPVWPVMGVMVNGPVFIDGKIEVSDTAKTEGIEVPNSLGGITEFATRNTIDPFVEKTFSDTQKQADFGLAMLKKNQPDLFFQTFLTMDRIQHYLWRYCDESDPTYPGDNRNKDAIREFYKETDAIIGRYLDACGEDDKLFVISDHGHGMRCTHCFNINEFLRRRGDLKSSADGKIISSKLIIERLKNTVLEFMHRHNLEDYISIIAKFIPNANKLKKGKYITNDNHNRAYASDFTGTNPFGGICINRDLVDDYEKFRDGLIEDFKNVLDGDVNIVEWVKCREEMFDGKNLERFPDILFSLKPKYGVNWNLHTDLFTINPTHKKISGGHKEYGVFLSNLSQDCLAEDAEIKMANFFATILAQFGLSELAVDKGQSFVKVKK